MLDHPRASLASLLICTSAAWLAADAAWSAPRATPSAELLHFTDDLSASGTPLLPGFNHHSMWSALGRASNGRIYMAVSNHQQPGGNSALFRYDPVGNEMALLGDLEGISSAVDNWMTEESQYKVHSFLMEHADGYMYFASDDHDPTPFLRGAHVYRIDPETEFTEDYSKTQPFLMKQNLAVIANTGQNAEQSGIFIEYYGIKGIGLHPQVPHLLYAMTFPDGHLIKYDLSDGSMQVIGQSTEVAYVFYVSRIGDVYYSDGDVTSQTLYKYDESEDSTSIVASDLPEGQVGAIAPKANGREVYFLMADVMSIYRLDVDLDEFSFFAPTCGTNWWRLFNLSLSPDEKSLYYVSNNNADSKIWRIDTSTGLCTDVLNVNALLGSRNLCFGGISVWDADGNFYAPVWTHNLIPSDLAMVKVGVEVPEPDRAVLLLSGLLGIALLNRHRQARAAPLERAIPR